MFIPPSITANIECIPELESALQNYHELRQAYGAGPCIMAHRLLATSRRTQINAITLAMMFWYRGTMSTVPPQLAHSRPFQQLDP